MRRTSRVMLWVFMVIALSACVPEDPPGPEAIRQDNGDVVASLGCERSAVKGVRVYAADSADVIWEFESIDDSGTDLASFRMFETPDGFVTVSRSTSTWTGGLIIVRFTQPGGDGATRWPFDSTEFGPDDGVGGWAYAVGDEVVESSWETYQQHVASEASFGFTACSDPSPEP